MKEWQRGYTQEELAKWEKKFSSFNQKCISPFMTMRSRTLAECLYHKEVFVLDDLVCRYKLIKKSTPIKIYTKHKAILTSQEQDDISIDRLVLNGENGIKSFKKLVKTSKNSIWVFTHEEDEDIKALLLELKFERVGAKFNSFGDSQTVYYLQKQEYLLFPKKHYLIEDHERAVASQFEDIHFDVSEIKKQLKKLSFFKHYSNYNSGDSWSALALRGYLSEPQFIIKPTEMKKKWLLAHQDKKFFLQDTSLMNQLDIEDILANLCTDTHRIHRVRLMKLKSGAIIERHTDQVDPDIGVGIGTLPRFHIPLVTNQKCKFQVWGLNGMKEFQMKEGELWYLDTRKPHRVVNHGEDRIHLVIDILADKSMVEWIKNSILIL